MLSNKSSILHKLLGSKRRKSAIKTSYVFVTVMTPKCDGNDEPVTVMNIECDGNDEYVTIVISVRDGNDEYVTVMIML